MDPSPQHPYTAPIFLPAQERAGSAPSSPPCPPHTPNRIQSPLRLPRAGTAGNVGAAPVPGRGGTMRPRGALLFSFASPRPEIAAGAAGTAGTEQRQRLGGRERLGQRLSMATQPRHKHSGSGGRCRPLSCRRKPRHQGSVVGCHRLPPTGVKNQLGRISDVSPGLGRGQLRAPSCTWRQRRRWLCVTAAPAVPSALAPLQPQTRHAQAPKSFGMRIPRLGTGVTPALPASLSPSPQWGSAGSQPQTLQHPWLEIPLPRLQVGNDSLGM